jgi:pyrimidine-specific ribonucleoside hydrolase
LTLENRQEAAFIPRQEAPKYENRRPAEADRQLVVSPLGSLTRLSSSLLAPVSLGSRASRKNQCRDRKSQHQHVASRACSERAAVVLTNEVHQHVGIYSIMGAKMGVRARELLDAPTRAVNVTVETGERPPVSCVIDGLQVALGSTLAQNLMHVPAPTEPRVAAVFEYKGRRLRLSLRPEFQRQIDEIIAAAVKECGDLTPRYFQRIEAFSYRVWAEFDRRAIFSEETVTASGP